MLSNYLTLGYRAMLRDPLFTIINLLGLAIGIAGCLLIVLFIRYEMNFDTWLPDVERTYLLERISTAGENSGQVEAMSPYVASIMLPGQYPEIEAATALVKRGSIFRRGDDPIRLDAAYVADPNFFKVLHLPLVAGDPATALSGMDSLVLTESAALRLFGRTDVLGQVITRIQGNDDQPARVTAILRDLPSNSHLRIDALFRTNTATGGPSDRTYASWDEISGWVYLRLRPGADAAAMNQRMPQVLQRIVPTVDRDPSAPDGLGFTSSLLPVAAINTAQIDASTMRPGTPAKTLVTFGIIAAFLLIVACVNFTNLATARAARRAREVGLRKTLGATRRQLVLQFLLEALMMVTAAGLLALAFAEIALPFLNDLLGSDVQLHYFGQSGMALPLILLLLAVALLSGLYPAFFLSRYRPALVLKANRSGAETPGAGRLRAALVVLQFAVSIGLIICTATIYAQTLYARLMDPGYRVPGLLFVQGPNAIGDRSQIETFMHRVAAIPGVTGVARAGIMPDSPSTSISTFRAPGATRSVSIQIVPVDGATFATFGMHMLAGRNVTEEREADVGAPMYGVDPERDRLIRARGLNVVVDASTARLLGYRTPQQAIGRQFVPDAAPGETDAPYTIVGVVNDARFESARFDSLPKLYFVAPAGHIALAVRFAHADGAAIRSAVETLWKASVDRAPFDAVFADERIERMYRADERRARLFAIFAGFAVLISCLGLFGLAAFTAQRRTKEIGIRKVLGARTRDIIRLLVWQFTRPVLLANLIAWPIAWWAMRDWLNEFQSHIDLGPAPFALAGLIAFAIAVGTIVGHAVKVARANPVHALRYE